LIILSASEFIIEIKRAPKKAAKNPETPKPSTKAAVPQRRAAFITNVKRPKVSKFIGKVRSIIIGFIKIFIKPRIRETKIASGKLSIEIPLMSSYLATRNIVAAVISILAKSRIKLS